MIFFHLLIGLEALKLEGQDAVDLKKPSNLQASRLSSLQPISLHRQSNPKMPDGRRPRAG